MLKSNKNRNGKKYKLYPIFALRQLILIMLSIVALYPLIFMLMTALKSKEEYVYNKFSTPEAIAWSNFTELFVKGNLPQWLFNSIVITICSVILALIVAIMFSFVISRYKLRFSEAILDVVIALMVIPPAVMIIPLFVFFAKINLINNYFGVILIYTGLVLPFSIYLLYSFFKSIPQELLDSASIDGCTSFGTLIKIIIPLSLPPIFTLLVVNALWVWNELLIALIFLQKDSLKTLMVGLATFKSRYTLNIPLTMMASLVITIPMILLYFFGQKYFIRGFYGGALKE